MNKSDSHNYSKMANKKERLNVRIPESEMNILRTYCNRTGRSQSDVIREFIRSLNVTRNPHIGSSLDDLLAEDGILAEVDTIARGQSDRALQERIAETKRIVEKNERRINELIHDMEMLRKDRDNVRSGASNLLDELRRKWGQE